MKNYTFNINGSKCLANKIALMKRWRKTQQQWTENLHNELEDFCDVSWECKTIQKRKEN